MSTTNPVRPTDLPLPIGQVDVRRSGLLSTTQRDLSGQGLPRKDETPAEKRARLALEKEKDKKLNKQRDAEIKAAQQVISKIASTLKAGVAIQAKSAYEMIASVIREPLDAAIEEMKSVEENASSIIAEGHGVCRWDIKTAAVQVATVKKHIAVASGMLATIARAVGA